MTTQQDTQQNHPDEDQTHEPRGRTRRIIDTAAATAGSLIDHWTWHGIETRRTVVPTHYGRQDTATLTRAAHGAHILTTFAVLFTALPAFVLADDAARGLMITAADLGLPALWADRFHIPWLATDSALVVLGLLAFLAPLGAVLSCARVVVHAARQGRLAPMARALLGSTVALLVWLVFVGAQYDPNHYRGHAEAAVCAFAVVFSWWLVAAASQHQAAIVRTYRATHSPDF